MKARNTLIIGAIIATFTAGASAAYLNGSIPVGARISVTALKADEGVPHNLVTAMKADEGVPQNLVTCDESGRRCTSHNLMAAFEPDEGTPHNLIVA